MIKELLFRLVSLLLFVGVLIPLVLLFIVFIILPVGIFYLALADVEELENGKLRIRKF